MRFKSCFSAPSSFCISINEYLARFKQRRRNYCYFCNPKVVYYDQDRKPHY